MIDDFDGTKVAIIRKDQILTLLRDDREDIPWPNQWDLPGGGRENNEDPIETAKRELQEEFGLILPEGRIVYHYQSTREAGGVIHFFLILWDSLTDDMICFGTEGQAWQFMNIIEFLDRHDVVPHHQMRLRLGLATL